MNLSAHQLDPRLTFPRGLVLLLLKVLDTEAARLDSCLMRAIGRALLSCVRLRPHVSWVLVVTRQSRCHSNMMISQKSRLDIYWYLEDGLIKDMCISAPGHADLGT